MSVPTAIWNLGFRKNGSENQPGYDPSIDAAGDLFATSQPFRLGPEDYDWATDPVNNAIYTDW